ncbi:uncharacterized protein EAE98_010552 [Botrytis deweyae]|uniref:Uncharacterized protein n=1 Tax=Botrytis deweyae TaxID=2478750 RepID=A0ABQ7I8M0_9HELO|nr:uncharacterized protein EAE98_010552 [Botrytis deweyae]KAF7916830.1 hypothetical protein EAE98_010552 [Botrytis deweyae]
MSPSRHTGTALAAAGDKVQRAGKRLTRAKSFLVKDQAVKIRKLRLQRLQRIKKRQADHTITKTLNKLSLNPTIEKKREGTIKQRS